MMRIKGKAEHPRSCLGVGRNSRTALSEIVMSA
jgi:hypothetical protein